MDRSKASFACPLNQPYSHSVKYSVRNYELLFERATARLRAADVFIMKFKLQSVHFPITDFSHSIVLTLSSLIERGTREVRRNTVNPCRTACLLIHFHQMSNSVGVSPQATPKLDRSRNDGYYISNKSRIINAQTNKCIFLVFFF